MPSLSEDCLLKLKHDYKKYPVFVETGTYYGNTIFAVEPFFNTLHTIEIKQEFYDYVQSQYTGNKIKFYNGDSSIIFNSILPSIEENTIFFLDGHWSAGNTGKGQKDCPLIEEVTSIYTYFKKSAILIIDDYRLFGKGPNKHNEVCNWEDISKESILKCLGDRITSVYHIESELSSDDRLIIHLNSL